SLREMNCNAHPAGAPWTARTESLTGSAAGWPSGFLALGLSLALEPCSYHGVMDREPDGVKDAESRWLAVRGSRRLLAAGIAVVIVLVAVIAVLAFRLGSVTSAAN